MLKRLLFPSLLIASASTLAVAQVPTTPPPWFDLEQTTELKNTGNALPEIDKETFPELEIELKASPLEQFYRARTKDETLEQFGYTLFAQSTPTTTSAPTGAVQDNYILGPRDELLITFTGQRSDQTRVTIDVQGQIIIKDIPPIPATGRSIADIREAINTYTQNMTNTTAHVSLTKIKQIGVLIVGHVENPGRKNMNAFNTIFDALRSAGGVQKQGSLRQIKLVRGGLSTTIDLYELLMDGAPGKDIMLKDGDRLLIPPIGANIALSGAVKRPGIYELKTTKTTISLNHALKYAGGVLAPGQNRFMRHAPSKTGTENITQITNKTALLFGNGTILNILRGTDAQSGQIEVTGHTDKPGLYDSRKHESLSALLQNPGMLGPDIYPLIGIIERQDKTHLSHHFITFSPQTVLKNKSDISLQENDKIILLSNKEIHNLKQNTKQVVSNIKINSKNSPTLQNDQALKNFLREQFLTLRGAVRKPDSYPIAQDISLETLLAAAGGTRRNANLGNIEITAKTRNGSETYRTTLNIDPHTPEYTNPSDVLLSPGDAVRVNQTQKSIKENAVLITGEIMHPGEYDLLPGDNVSSLLTRAGGLTEQAYPAGAIFSRESQRRTEELRYRNTARDLERRLASAIDKDTKNPPSAAQIEMVQGLAQQLSTIQAIGRITVEIDPDILELEPALDMLLEHGDKIYIPKRPLTVRVAGEVFSPAALQFRKDKDHRDYISEAGGFTKAADKNRTFVLYPDGSAQPLKVNTWNHTPIMIPPGSTIVVPLDPKPFNFLQSAKEIGQIVGNLAVTAVFVDDIRD